MASIFSKIIAGDIPCFKIAESDHYFAFLDIRPLAKGHTLVVPKKEVDDLFDVDDETLAGMLPFAKKVAHALKKSIVCKRVGMMVIGTEVPHAHLHLIPFQTEAQISVTRPPISLTKTEMEAIAKKVSKAFGN